MFSSDRSSYGVQADRCDQCGAARRRYLEFGGTSELEMPVDPDGALYAVLDALRDRLERRRVLLCYECTDDLQEPISGPRFQHSVSSISSVIVAAELTPRLFEV